MKTNGKILAKPDVRWQGATLDDVPTEVLPSSMKRVQQLETLDDLERVSHNVPPLYDSTSHRIAVVLAGLVLMCVVLAVIVWWRLLA